jgi:hypothetical protein
MVMSLGVDEGASNWGTSDWEGCNVCSRVKASGASCRWDSGGGFDSAILGSGFKSGRVSESNNDVDSKVDLTMRGFSGIVVGMVWDGCQGDVFSGSLGRLFAFRIGFQVEMLWPRCALLRSSNAVS